MMLMCSLIFHSVQFGLSILTRVVTNLERAVYRPPGNMWLTGVCDLLNKNSTLIGQFYNLYPVFTPPTELFLLSQNNLYRFLEKIICKLDSDWSPAICGEFDTCYQGVACAPFRLRESCNNNLTHISKKYKNL